MFCPVCLIDDLGFYLESQKWLISNNENSKQLIYKDF